MGVAGPGSAQGAVVPWTPPEPQQDGFDWIQLKSGEWLKGRIIALQEEELEFDSEELDHQSFDWEDVLQLRSPHVQDVLFDDRVEASGPVSITPREITIGGAMPSTHPRARILSLTPGGSRRDFWSGEVSLGGTLRSGNTKEVQYNGSAELHRLTPWTRLRLEYLGNISQVEGVESANDHRLSGEFDYWLSKRLYLLAPIAEYYTDSFQNISRRVTLGVGVGYELIDRNDMKWKINAGPAYQVTRFDSVPAGEPASQDALAGVLGSEYEWEISRRTDLFLDYRGQYSGSAGGGAIHHTEGTLKVELSKWFDLKLTLVWDRVADPEIDASGTLPEKNDYRMILALAAEF